MFIQQPLTKQSKRSLVCGVGINDATYQVTLGDYAGKRVICPFYQVWQSMLKRCYSTKYLKKYPTYETCFVHHSWHTFSVFRNWMVLQNWEGMVLDKDLLIQGNKEYGPDNCVFIRQELNKLLCLHGRARGELPLGLSYTQRVGKKLIAAQCNFYGKKTHLGYFTDVVTAAEVYKTAKLNYIAELAANESDLRIKQALLRLH